jgi:hypothetical protein
MGRLLEIARAALTEAEPQDAKRTDNAALTLIQIPVPKTGQAIQDLDHPCRHCGGTGECSCISCGHLESHGEWKTGPCVPCGQKNLDCVQ